MSEDAGGTPGELAGAELPGLPGARLRTAGPADAASLLRLQQRLDRETSFMLLEPGLFVDGRFIDELYMAALLPGPIPPIRPEPPVSAPCNCQSRRSPRCTRRPDVPIHLARGTMPVICG